MDFEKPVVAHISIETNLPVMYNCGLGWLTELDQKLHLPYPLSSDEAYDYLRNAVSAIDVVPYANSTTNEWAVEEFKTKMSNVLARFHWSTGGRMQQDGVALTVNYRYLDTEDQKK